MNPNIFRFEFRRRLKSALIWALAAAAVSLTYLGLYPSLAREAALFDQAMRQFPPQFLQAFGMENLNMGTIMGFYSFVFLFTQALLAVQASLAGFGLVSMEETESTADFLLTRPVTRTHVLTSKLLAAMAALTVTAIAVGISSLLFLKLFQAGRGYDRHAVVLLLASMPVFQLTFLSLGLFLSLLVRVRSVTFWGLGLGLGMYVLAAFSGMLGDAKLELITPFKHFDPNAIIQQGAYDLPLVAISLTYILIALAGSYWRFLHRDIPAMA